MLSRQRRILVKSPIRVLVLLAALTLPAARAAEPWPARPITVVAPAGAGGTADLFARLVGEGLTRELGRPVLIENRPGAGTNIGNLSVAQAKPDGYTLLLGAATLAINPHLYKNLAYDPVRDFRPVRLVARMPNVVVVRGDGPLKSTADLIELARAHPGRFNYGSPGSGTSVHLATELFKSMTGIALVHVPYKSSALSAGAVLSGDVLVAFENMPVVLGLVKAGKLRALAVTSASRSSSLPEVPTVAEAGVKGYEVAAWFGLLAPAGVPPEVVSRLDEAAQRALLSPETKERIRALGAEPAEEGPEAFERLMRAESQKWGTLIRAANITAE
jgi:tripartite-type tricarboxylate transporter receptor subunit TctC